jgi:phosphate transport system permease protein
MVSQTEMSAETADSDREPTLDTPAEDPAVSPAEGHQEPAHQVRVRVVSQHAAPTPAPVAGKEKTTGVKLARISRTGDLVFGGLSGASGMIIVLLVVFVGVFLLALALPALLNDHDNFLTSRNWVVGGAELRFGIVDLLWTTVLTSILAMIVAVPVAVGVALFLTHYLHKQAAGPLSFVIDLLAAVPSIVFGLWGLLVLGPAMAPAAEWLSTHLGFLPIFEPVISPRNSAFTAGVVLAIMVLPIVTAISRDVFAQTPRDHIEAALALGATRWEMIRTAVLPYGRSGVISASMLGLGRALGETIAVMIILSQPAPGSPFTPSIFAGGETFASKIANNAAEFDSPSKTGAYIAAGLVLFVVTFVVNVLARVIAERGSAK